MMPTEKGGKKDQLQSFETISIISTEGQAAVVRRQILIHRL